MEIKPIVDAAGNGVNLIDFLQYGALGIVGFIVVWGLKMLSGVADRFVVSLDKLDTTLASMTTTIYQSEVAAEKRHGDTRAWLKQELTESRHATNVAMTPIVLDFTKKLDQVVFELQELKSQIKEGKQSK